MRRTTSARVSLAVLATGIGLMLIAGAPGAASANFPGYTHKELREKLRAAKSKVKRLTRTLDVTERREAKQRHRAKSAEAALARARAEITTKDSQLTQKDGEIAQKDVEITDRDAQIADRDAQIEALQTEINAALSALGGTGTLAQRIEDIEDALRPDATQTNVTADVAAARSLVTASPGSDLEADLTTVNVILGGSGTTQARATAALNRLLSQHVAGGPAVLPDIGAPTVNGVASTLGDMVGGTSGASLAANVGDPVTGTTGLAAMIRNNGASVGTVNGFDASGFDNATSINAQVAAFLSVLNQSNAVATTQIQIPKSAGFTSLRDVLASLNHD